jgi:uncharacterized RDD family membrane protein YckC
MPWHYVENGERKGPVADIDLERLAAAGTVRPETLVWREGMANWQSYREATATPLRDRPPGSSDVPAASAEAYCVECGSPFAPGDMLRFEGAFVCAACKPAFFQRLKEGSHFPTARKYAGFRIRLGAKLIDGLIILVAQTAVTLLFAVLFLRNASGQSMSAAIAVQGLIMLGQVLLGTAYTCWFLVNFGATPGKMACRLKVITAEGGPITFGRALGRHFAEFLSGMTLLIGYVMAAFDEEKRALHDRICNTRVVRA